MQIRDLAWGDFPDLVDNYYRCYGEREAGRPIGIVLFDRQPGPVEETRWFSHLYESVQEGGAVACVAEVDGKAVGLCTVLRAGPGAGSETAHVGGLGVLVRDDVRGKGVGRALIEETLRRCRGKFELVTLAVFVDNERAKRLYLSLGFQRYGTLPRSIKRGDRYIDEELMYRFV